MIMNDGRTRSCCRRVVSKSYVERVLLTMNLLFQIRDAKAVGNKFRHVLFPTEAKSLLQDCELKFMLTFSGSVPPTDDVYNK